MESQLCNCIDLAHNKVCSIEKLKSPAAQIHSISANVLHQCQKHRLLWFEMRISHTTVFTHAIFLRVVADKAILEVSQEVFLSFHSRQQ